MAILSGMSLMCRWTLALWHGKQVLVQCAMSLFIPGQTNFCRICCRVDLPLGCAKLWTVSKIFLPKTSGMYGLMTSSEHSQYNGNCEPVSVNCRSFKLVLPSRISWSSSSCCCFSANSSVVTIVGHSIAEIRDNASAEISLVLKDKLCPWSPD